MAEATARGRKPTVQQLIEEMAMETLAQCRERAVVSIEEYRKARELIALINSAKARSA